MTERNPLSMIMHNTFHTATAPHAATTLFKIQTPATLQVDRIPFELRLRATATWPAEKSSLRLRDVTSGGRSAQGQPSPTRYAHCVARSERPLGISIFARPLRSRSARARLRQWVPGFRGPYVRAGEVGEFSDRHFWFFPEVWYGAES